MFADIGYEFVQQQGAGDGTFHIQKDVVTFDRHSDPILRLIKRE